MRTVRKKSASRYENVMVIASVSPNCEKNSPICPGKKEMGRNTAKSESVEARTAAETSPAPWMTASRPRSPSSRSRVMFSAMTMESSTTMPIATVMAKSVMMLKVNPKRSKKMSAPASEIGTASITEKTAPKLPTKISTTNATIKTTRKICDEVAETVFAMNVVSSPTISAL